ncbi:hypothetical protein BGZ83_010087 [Gryganskiella cystojenkinii]|nr:hypothetical protein BGZ83_010087 [Gryganskiella cystojenkinii]
MIENAFAQWNQLPLEIQERVAYYTDAYACCALGFDLSSPLIRQCLFLSGGSGVVLTEILSRGADPRALFTIRDHVPSNIAIAKAVIAGSGGILRRVMAIWGTNVSWDASMLAFKRQDDYAMKILGDHSRCPIHKLNAYFFSRGMYEKVDETVEDPYVYLSGFGKLNVEIPNRILDISSSRTRASILEANKGIPPHNALEEMKEILALTDGPEITSRLMQLEMRKSLYGIKALIDLVFKGIFPEVRDVDAFFYPLRHLLSMVDEEVLLRIFSLRPTRYGDHTDAVHLIDVLGSRAFGDRWGDIIRWYIDDRAPEVADCLYENGLGDMGLAMIEAGYDIVTNQKEGMFALYARKLVEMYGESILGNIHGIYAASPQDAHWLLLDMHGHFTIGDGLRSCLCVVDGTLYFPNVPEEYEVSADEETDESVWTSIRDTALCCHVYRAF